jgi:hypothetical protein
MLPSQEGTFWFNGMAGDSTKSPRWRTGSFQRPGAKSTLRFRITYPDERTVRKCCCR